MTKKNVPVSIAVGGLLTAATLTLAYLYQRKRTAIQSTEGLFDACECALKRMGYQSAGQMAS